MMNEFITHYQTEFSQIFSQLPGRNLPWLEKSRMQAMAYFVENGLPSRQQEAWKYTAFNKNVMAQLSALKMPSMTEEASSFDADIAIKKLLSPDDCYQYVFVAGIFQPQLSSQITPHSGCDIRSLAQAFIECPDRVEPYLGRIASHSAHGFSALNTAFWQDGLFIELAPQVIVDKPIVITHIGQPRRSSCSRHFVLAHAGASATIIEHYIDAASPLSGENYFTNNITEIMVAEHAHIEHYKIQQEGRGGVHISTLHAQQEYASTMNSYVFSLGAALARSDVIVKLAAETAQCNLSGLYLAQAQQHLDHYTLIEHLKPNGVSKEYYKGIIADKAHAVFNGKVYVAPSAQKTLAQQHNKNLLLSRLAEIDTRPQLEIYADDVKCAHGATVGQVDDDALFYLCSRGLDRAAAQTLLIQAFAEEIITQIPLANLRAALEKILTNHLLVTE